jgi:Cdc6-like AAA superfamily ATPase
MAEVDVDRARLEDDLDKLAERGVDRAFRPVEKNPALDLRELPRIIERLYPAEWTGTEAQKVEAIKKTLRRVINEDTAFNRPIARSSSMAHRRMAEVMYDLVDTTVPREWHRKALKDEGGSPRHTSVTASILKAEAKRQRDSGFDRYTSETREILTQALLDLWTQLQPVTFRSISEDPSYTQRLELHTEFQDAIRTLQEQGKRVLIFRGDAGTGKSTLALKLAPSVVESDDDVVVIRAHSERRLANDILDYFERAGTDVSGWSDMYARRRLKSALSRGDAPSVVVLDNIGDKETLGDLLPDDEPRSLVLVTCRKKLLSDGRGAELTIGNMSAEEANMMLRAKLSDVPDDALRLLASRLDYRPLALEQASAYLHKMESVTVEQFCEALKRSRADVLDSLPGDETLTAIYRMILNDLKRAPNSVRLLDLLLCAPLLSITRRTARLLWADLTTGMYPSEEVDRRFREYQAEAKDVLRSNGRTMHLKVGATLERLFDSRDDAYAIVVAGRATDELLDWGLIRLEGDVVALHELTYEIIRELRHENLAAMRRDILKITHALVKRSEWRQRSVVTAGALLDWIPVANLAVREFLRELLKRVPESAPQDTIEAVTECRPALVLGVALSTWQITGVEGGIKGLSDRLQDHLIVKSLYDAVIDANGHRGAATDVLWSDLQAYSGVLYSICLANRPHFFGEARNALAALEDCIDWPQGRALQIGDEWWPCSLEGFRPTLEQKIERRIEMVADKASSYGPQVIHGISDESARYHEAAEDLAAWILARGTVAFDACEWSHAHNLFDQVFRISAALARSPSDVRNALDALRRLVELAVRAGYSDKVMTTYYGHFEQIGAAAKIFGSRIGESADRLSYTRFQLAMEDARRNSYYTMFASDDYTEEDELVLHVRGLCDVYENLREGLIKIPASRFIPGAIQGYAATMAMIEPGLSCRVFLNAYDEAKEFRYSFAAQRALLGLYKSYVCMHAAGLIGEVPSSCSKSALAVARRFAKQRMSPYWYADAMCVAYVLAALGNRPLATIRGLRSLAEGAVGLCNRPDKLEVADRVSRGECPAYLLYRD